ncbi:MAG: hypothetical protein AAF942_03265 [Pseudomonadota bacterium]
MSAFDIIALAIPGLIVLLGGYLVVQLRRSREAELNYSLRKTRIALEDTENALENTITYYKAEIRRLKTRLGEPVTEEALAGVNGMNGTNGHGGEAMSDMKFKQARTAFARLYHPDRHRGDAEEKRLRSELFKEFWEELERIDRRNP